MSRPYRGEKDGPFHPLNLSSKRKSFDRKAKRRGTGSVDVHGRVAHSLFRWIGLCSQGELCDV